MESHLREALIFARRWSTHESRDFSRQRFEKFASVLIQELPGFHAMELVPPDLGPGWVVASGDRIQKAFDKAEHRQVLHEASNLGKAILSAPLETRPGATSVFAALPLQRGNEFLGYLVVDFLAKTLINDCFHTRIRSEFYFIVQDEDQVLFRSSPDVGVSEFHQAPIRASTTFPVSNRMWQLTMVPKKETVSASSWTVNLPVLFLGILLSIGLSLLVYLLLRRMEMFRAARDQQSMLSRKVLMAQEEERSRVSRELHDELGQLLTALRLEMGWLEKRISAVKKDERVVLDNTVLLVEQAIEELRRMCRGLRPPLLDDLGLGPAANLLVEEFQGRAGTEVNLDLALDVSNVPVSKEVILCAYRILQESLTNVSRHARAKKVSVKIAAEPGELTISVVDDGVGFDTDNLGAMQGWGLEGMQERANLVGGAIEVNSAPGQGTRVFFKVPLGIQEEEKTP